MIMSTPTAAIFCRSLSPAPVSCASNEIVYLPAGIVEGVPSQNQKAVSVQLLVTAASAVALEAQRRAIVARGDGPFFDFNHDDRDASFRPSEFFWREGTGVIARGEWTKPGSDAIEGKSFRGFSPVCHVDDAKRKPCAVICNPRANPNMGGLVNNAAFKSIPAFFAKEAGTFAGSGTHSTGAAGGQQPTNQTDPMNEQEQAALRAKNQELENEIAAHKAEQTALKAKNQSDALVASEIKAKEAELKGNASALELAALKAKNAALEAQDQSRRTAHAKKFVGEMVTRGAIAAKDTAAIADAEKNLASDPATFEPIYAKWQGSAALGGRITQSANVRADVQVGKISAKEAVEAYGALMGKQSAAGTMEEKKSIAREAYAIWAADLRDNASLLDMPLVGANSIGTASGTLVTQRTLELLTLNFPMLKAITADFSDEAAQWNQTIKTRIIGIPAVTDYNSSTGYANSDVTATDVPVTISNHKAVNITFDANTLASTVRNLFAEQAAAASYAIAKNMVDALYALILKATYASNTNIIKSAATFGRPTVIDMATALDIAGIPTGPNNRTLLLNATYFGALSKDSTIISLAAFQDRGLITDNILPNVAGFKVVSAPNLPSNGDLITGFGMSRSALVIAGRVPNDYTTVLPGASFGNVTVVTNPDLGFSVQQVQFVNHTLGAANQRLAFMYGVASGQVAAGQTLTSA